MGYFWVKPKKKTRWYGMDLIMCLFQAYLFICSQWDKEIIELKDLGTTQNQAIERLDIENFKLPFELGNRLEKRVKVKVV